MSNYHSDDFFAVYVSPSFTDESLARMQNYLLDEVDDYDLDYPAYSFDFSAPLDEEEEENWRVHAQRLRDSDAYFDLLDQDLYEFPEDMSFAQRTRTASSKVDHPTHYTAGNIECIEAIEEQLTPEELRGYYKGNAAKYIWREQHKGSLEDIKKARWYLDRLIDTFTDA